MAAYREGKWGVGIRGTGQVAVQHAEAVLSNPDVYVAAICGRTAEKAAAFAAAHAPGAKAYDDLDSLLSDPEVGIVVECMPNHLHASESIRILQAGKHLVLEKPVGITQEETDALYETACASPGKTVVSFLIRWTPLVANLKSLIDGGAIGKIYYSGTDYWHGIKPTFSSYNWIRRKEFAGGAMITGGCHAADAARYLNGEAAEVAAFSTFGRPDFDYDTTLSASVRFRNGSVGRISASLDGLAFPYQFNLDFLGTEGAIRNGKIYSKKLFPAQTDWVNLPMIGPETGSVDHHPFKQEWAEFTDCLNSGKDPRSTLPDACRSMDIVHAITESARTGKPVLIRER